MDLLTLQAIYESPWHDPVLFWVCGLCFLALLARSVRPLVAFATLFAIEIMADALITGGLSPLPRASAASAPFSVLFVVLGDLRYFLLLERSRRDKAFASREVLGRALPLSLLVPVISFVIPRLAPGAFRDARATYLLYELLFFALAVVVLLGLRGAHLSPSVRRYLRELTLFEAAQYALWAASDVLILSGHDLGFGLRLIPNFMYYAAFLPFALLRDPAPAARPAPTRAATPAPTEVST